MPMKADDAMLLCAPRGAPRVADDPKIRGMPEPDPPITDHATDGADCGSRSDLRVHSPHLKGGEGTIADHFRAAHVRTPSMAHRVANESHESAEPSIEAQLRTHAVQLADHLSTRQEELDRREAELNTRAAAVEANLSEARQWLSEREAALERLRREWIEERRRAEAELDAARQRMDQQRHHDWAELTERRRALELRAEQVDRASVAVQRMWEEVARLHRETLEQRLANEELSAQLAPLAPAEVRQSMLREIRAKLAEEYRRANEELGRRKEELKELRHELSRQYRKLVKERDRIHRDASHATAPRQSVPLDVAKAKTEPLPRE